MLISRAELIKQGVMQGTFPKRLYKYRPLDGGEGEKWSLAILEKSEFWFASAPTFNDPFDCNLSEVLQHSEKDYEAYLTESGLTPEQKSNIYMRMAEDPSYIRNKAIKNREKVINSKGILSLSCNYDQILMWSHYASSHTGMVIGLDLLEDPEFFVTPLRVSYVDEYEPLDYFADQKGTIEKNITTKSLSWAYEEEMRIFKKSFGTHSIVRQAIKTIHFGCKTPDEKMHEIIKNCAGWGLSHVRFYKASQAHGAFKLTFDEVHG
ncbi:DUF2971 domain-containing protein [Paludibacterium denitrificans]|uniref:DUF2971 domain-containing protein n=1 Tax=Paludibacterium denitrificans TaxID=2675226 RepID=A0A844GDR9_9NEIS|nr:DUF2971 domain-containing protein [Paludibacterium denitrificans]MTD33067.1 DUF2971 domain-containing protein [Paludibacterium denitrificans]